MELVRDAETREPLAPLAGAAPEMAAITRACRERGVLVLPSQNRIHLVPPLIATQEQVETAVGVLDEALAEVLG